MALLVDALIALIALLHLYFLVLEVFLWDKPIGLRIFAQTAEEAAIRKTLAANQGIYNAFLAIGLLWGLVQGQAGHQIKVFFLLCVIVAGAFGGMLVSRKILIIQAIPAIITLILLFAWA